MNTAMKVLSILGVLLRWAFWGDDGGTEAPNSLERFPLGQTPLRNAVPREEGVR
jgi:hypothetical protein